ncbi:MAG: flagellar brake protein [Bacillota bacterium]
MAKLDGLTIHQKIEISFPDDPRVFKSMIQDAGDDYLAIQVPFRQKIEMRLRAGDRVKVTAFGDNYRYRFYTSVRGSRQDQIPLFILEMPSDMEREQLRNFVRIHTTLDVYYRLPSKPDEQVYGQEAPETHALTMDISGGGMQLTVKEPCQHGEIFTIRFSIPDKRGPVTIKTEARVKRCTLSLAEGPPTYIVGLEFRGISERERDVIVSYIFQRMREIHRR